MNYNLSVAVFIRNATQGFCLWESVASLLYLASEFVIMDCGSTDGTIPLLREVAEANPKVKVILRDSFPTIDAGVFATLANELIDFCHYDNVLYYQADEIWHEDLLKLTQQRLEAGQFDLSFWRIQYRENWQAVKWFPHLVHRIGQKGNFNFMGDGMNSDRVWDAKICSDYGGEYFPQWGGFGQEGIKPFVNQMITDVSLVGGFLENIPERRGLHAPFWHEPTDIEGLPANRWIERERQNQNWYKIESPYNLPAILRYHLGRVRYELRPELFEAIKRNRTAEYLENLTSPHHT